MLIFLMKKLSVKNHIVLLILGILFLVAWAGNGDKFTSEFIGANILLLGSLVCYLRKSKKWMWLEILALLLLAYLIAPTFMTGAWYVNPFDLLLPPIAVLICYIYTFLKAKEVKS